MSKFVGYCTWDEVPHLTQAQKDELYEGYPVHMRQARSKGIPMLGSGAIYPVAEENIVCDPIQLQPWWPRAFGMDVGWRRTAAVWGATDPDSGVTYLYSEHYQGAAEAPVHAEAIKSRGAWIPGAIDPASRTSSQSDGKQLLRTYLGLGLNLVTADNGVSSGILTTWALLSSGKLKVFKSLTNWLTEFRLYRRNDKGAVVKENDHLMDATRYLVVTGLSNAVLAPDAGQHMMQQMNRGAQRVYDPWAGL